MAAKRATSKAIAEQRTGHPSISVVIPLYNRAGRIAAAIDSILAQTFADFEIIVVDDGSSDAGPMVVEGYDDPRVRLLRLGANRGANVARNAGIQGARGRIVSFLDSDDVYLPNKLETVAAAFAARPELGVLIDSYVKHSPKGRTKECRNPRLDDNRTILEGLFDRRIWKSTSGISVSRDAAVRAGLFDESLKRRQEFDFLVRLLRTELCESSDAVTWVKTHTADSITADLGRFSPAFFDFWDRHPAYYLDPGLRRGFCADLARHAGQLALKRQWQALGNFLCGVRERIGVKRTTAALAEGALEVRRLAAHRRLVRRAQAKAASPSRIAIFVDDFEATGVVNNAVAIANRLHDRGWQVEMVALRPEGTLRDRLAGGIRVTGLFAPDESFPRKQRLRKALARYWRFARKSAPDILFSAGNHGNLSSLIATIGLRRTKLVVRVSNDFGHRADGKQLPILTRLWRAAKLRLIAAQAAGAVFVSQRLHRDALELGAPLDGKAVVIPNGVDVAGVRQRTNGRPPHPWFAQSATIPVVLGVGRLVKQKNFATLIAAVARANQSRPLRLLLIGAGPLEQGLLEQAQAAGIADSVEIIPPVANPMPFIAAASVVALPSWWEGASNVLLEALACGTAVVASYTAGSADEVLDGGRYGLLIDPGDPVALARSLLHQCGPDRILPGNRAADFSREHALADYAELFERVAGRGPA